MAIRVSLASGAQDVIEAGFLHATCGQIIPKRDFCPYCKSRPIIESIERVVPWAKEEPDGTLIVYRGNWVANAYPPGVWLRQSKD